MRTILWHLDESYFPLLALPKAQYVGRINGETEEESEFLTPKNGTGNECLMARLKTGGSE